MRENFKKRIKGVREKKLRKKKIKDRDELKKLEMQLAEIRKKREKKSKIPTKDVIKFWGIGFLVVIIGYFSYKAYTVLLLILTALIVSIALEAIIEYFAKKLPRSIAVFLTYFLFIIFFLLGLILVIPFTLHQAYLLIQQGVQTLLHWKEIISYTNLTEIITSSNLPHFIKNSILQSLQNKNNFILIQQNFQQNISNIVSMWSKYAKNIVNLSINFLTGFFGFIWQFLIVITLAVLFSLQKNNVINFISNLFGKSQKLYMEFKLKKIYKKLGLWLKGQLFLSLFIGGMVYISLLILSLFGVYIPQKGILGIISGFTEFFPYIGPIMGGTVSFLVAVIHNGFWAGLIVVGIFSLIQWLENNVIIPLIMNKTIGLNPITVLISMLLGGLIMGFVGVLLAIPFAIIISMFFEEEHEEEKNNE